MGRKIAQVMLTMCCGLILSACTPKQDFSSPPTKAEPDRETYFSYTCPSGWKQANNKDYNARVNTSECVLSYTSGSFSFDDGIRILFGFVPRYVADNVKVGKELYSYEKFAEIQQETNTQAYTKNNFTGRLSPKNPKHTLSLIARYVVDDGYYEVNASAVGDTHSDQEYKKMIDDIISSFNIK